MEDLVARFDAAAQALPLAALAPVDARELRALLDSVGAFEELPGRWQAALLQAESGSAGTAPGGHCCAHHHDEP